MSGKHLSSVAWWSLSVLLGIGVAAAVVLTPPIKPSTNTSHPGNDLSNPLGPAYVGDAACARCHPAEAEMHQGHGHAHTLQSADLCDRFAALLDRDFPDPERKGAFRFECTADGLVAVYIQDGQPMRLPIQFAVGSGTHAVTFLTLIESANDEPAGIEHRLSVFAKDVGLTPGQSGLPLGDVVDCLGRVKRGRDVIRCIECHSTTGQVRGTQVADLRANVGCERCHGPGRQHLAAVERGLADIAVHFAPGAASAEDEVHLCGRCHRLPEALKTLPDPDDKKLVRFQPIGLLQSACFRRSNGALRCSTCHNPHQTVERGGDSYNHQCQQCHAVTDGTKSSCTISPSGDCIACHMPVVEVHPGISFHDHWIRKREATTPRP